MKHPLPPPDAPPTPRRAGPSRWIIGTAALACSATLALAAGTTGTPAPAPADQPVDRTAAAVRRAPVHTFTLANGMTLIVKPDHRAPTAVNMLWVRVGAMDEVDGTTGLAHLLEHLLFKGTPTVPEGEFSKRVAAMGGNDNAFTMQDATGYYQQVPAARLREVMQLEADRFANTRWSDDAFAKEIEVVKEERRMRTEDNPRAQLAEVMDATTFLAHPYRRPVVGWMADLETVTADDARAFYRRWYHPAHAAVVIAGDVDVDQVRAWAEASYGQIPAQAVPARKPRREPVQAGLRRLAFKATAQQAVVSLAFKVPSVQADVHGRIARDADTQDALALTVLAAVLDGYDGARLARALTQSAAPVADSASASFGLSGRGPQLFTLSAIPAQGKTAAQVEAALRAQVQRIARHGVGEAELRRVKTQWMAAQVYRHDQVFAQAEALGLNWVQGFGVDADDELLARLRQVPASAVQAVAARYFGDDGLTVGVLLPQPLPRPTGAGAAPPTVTRP